MWLKAFTSQHVPQLKPRFETSVFSPPAKNITNSENEFFEIEQRKPQKHAREALDLDNSEHLSRGHSVPSPFFLAPVRALTAKMGEHTSDNELSMKLLEI